MSKWYNLLRCFVLGFPLLSLGQTPAQNLTDGKKTLTNQEFRALIDSSDTYYFNGKYKESLKLNIDLLQHATVIEEPYLLHLAYRNLAYDYLAITDTVMAQDSFIKSQKFAQEAKNDTAIALTYMDLANMYATVQQDFALADSYQPYLGFGFGRKAGHEPGFSITLDVGVALLDPSVELEATVNAGGTNGLSQAELDQRLAEMESDADDELDDFEAWPIIALGLNYAF